MTVNGTGPVLRSQVGTERSVAFLLTPVIPDAGGTGLALRAWAWMSTLSLNHEVRVLVVDKQPPLHDAPGASAEWVFAGHRLGHTRRWRLLLGWCLPWLAGLTRTVVMDWCHLLPVSGGPSDWPPMEVHGQVERIVAFRVCVHEFAQAVALRFPQARLEMDLDDLESDTRFSLAGAQMRMGCWGQALRTASVGWQYRCLETPVLRHYTQAWLAAPEDVSLLQARLGGRLSVGCFPNRLQVPQVMLGPPPSEGLFNMLFVGSLNYAPNVEGVLWLLRCVLPCLRRRRPTGWRFIVVGRQPSAALVRQLQQVPEAELWPDAPSLREFYAQAHVAVVPLRSGGGTKLKALEAFAWRRPVLTTTHGARGLGVRDGVHCLVADRASDIADRLVLLRDQPALGARLSDAAWHKFNDAFALPVQGSVAHVPAADGHRKSTDAHTVHRLS